MLWRSPEQVGWGRARSAGWSYSETLEHGQCFALRMFYPAVASWPICFVDYHFLFQLPTYSLLDVTPPHTHTHLGEEKKEKLNLEGHKRSHCRGAGLCKRHEQPGPGKLSRMEPGRPSLPTHVWLTHWHSRSLNIHVKGLQSPGQRLAVYTPDMENVWGGERLTDKKLIKTALITR